MVMDTVTATNTVIAIPTSITMVMAMDMAEMKNNEVYYLIIMIQKNHRSAVVFLWMVYFLNFRKISLIEIPESIPIECLVFWKGLEFLSFFKSMNTVGVGSHKIIQPSFLQ